MHNLTVTTIQTSLYWKNAEQNLNHFTQLLQSINSPTDVIVLPEMFTTGFSMNSSALAETMQGESVKWLLQQAKEQQALIIGSLIIEEGKRYYNRLIAAFPNGNMQHYDKRHLFRMANEDEHFSGGKHKLLITHKGWNISPYICYDLRFPVWSRNTNKTDLYIYVANWPSARVSAWSSLLKARAIENLAYTIGVNRIGTDGKTVAYNGQSVVIDYKGDYITQHHEKNSVITTTLSKQNLIDFRIKFPAHLDADNFTIHD